MARIPASIITGALGSGKTTLLNYLLTENHGTKIGVIVNEFGDVGIDADLIVQTDDDVIELPNGCVCCTVRGDLVEAIKKTLRTGVEYLLIETSGMAEPGPVANTFLVPELPEIRTQCRLDGIITLVDAENFLLTLRHGPTVEEQVAAADVVLLNKADLVREEDLARVEEKIKEISPKAFIFRTERARAPVNVLLSTGKFDVDRWVEQGRDKEVHHEHTDFVAVSVSSDSPLRLDAVSDLMRSLPENVFRAKGVLCIGNYADPKKALRMVWQKVGKRVESTLEGDWKEEGARSRLVLIGKGIDKDEWQERLDACVLAKG